MSVSAISSTAVSNLLELQKQTQPPAPSHSSSALPTDTVTLSPAAQKAVGGGDVDHDGDSH
jgi:hypothetical protein